MKQILIRSSIFFIQIAILMDGKLEDFIYEDKSKESFLGNIYKGRVESILPGIEAAFINVGLDKNAYVFKDDLLSDKFLKEKNVTKKEITSISRVLKKGEEVLVQINREPIGEKNISVTTDISLPGKLIALIPKSTEVNISAKIKNQDEKKRLLQIGKDIMRDGNGMIIRTFAENKDSEEIKNEYDQLSHVYNQIQREYKYSYAPKLLFKSNSIIERLFKDYLDTTVDEIYVEDVEMKNTLKSLIASYGMSEEFDSIKIIETADNVFELFNIDKQIDMLHERKVDLDNGGSIFIDVTEAMTVIDVNSGKYIGNLNMDETAFTLNSVALEEIARQVKLRNISGIIIVDFIDMKNPEYISLLIDKAKKVFKSDKAKTEIIEMTKLNLMEITRKKNKENFFNLMTKDCEHCRGGGRVSSNVQIIMKIENIIRRISNHTSSEAVILRVGNIMYYKMINSCKDEIKKIEDKYNINIVISEDKDILTDEIFVDRIGKLENINL